ncbi:MAG: hypothetical protein A3G34_01880 [Candidatus Lindowbacteria bacterium RIFCSPLOWO2_12_FULL_62_27]|nr:MAG: hypothetical protein A3I06_05820 [Candidatus Lindowbacteria bacterium RIFCSPLOWO2_02_FULL_62_12]OGH59058.1 MAG: hypothetical protein A3G34_01880 [Candidatus Lindowbacteria bacterium RIFCSPLOWO2_12_FULL_62_27]
MKSPDPVLAAPSVLLSDSTGYPAAVRQFFGKRPPDITLIGNAELLKSRPMALFCSIRCPGDLILKLYDLVRAARDAGIPIIGGFHTPMEKECLDLLLRGSQPIILCPARGIEGMPPPKHLKPGLDSGRILIVSPFPAKHRRVTSDLAEKRNLFIAALAHEVFVAHAAPGGLTEKLCRTLISLGKSVLTLESSENKYLQSIGARPITIENFIKRSKNGR